MQKKRILAIIITFFIAILIFYMSSLTFASSGEKSFSAKPIVYHIGIYFFLASFLLIAINNKKLIPLVIAVSIFYGITDEIHQHFVPSRAATLLDLFYNTTGILAAAVFNLTIKLQQNRNHPKV
jgi:uncharacterized membrane protein YozB (DUF420 family)